MAPPERRLSAEAKPFAPPAGPALAKVVSRDDDDRRRAPGPLPSKWGLATNISFAVYYSNLRERESLIELAHVRH